MTKNSNSFYCSQKFWWLSLDFEKLETSSCCSAMPQKINIEWIKKNPGKIFNTPEAIKERELMLTGIPLRGCASNCWYPESQGLPSRRTQMKSDVMTHCDLESDVEVLNLNIGKSCNLSCVYCCKQYSSAWSNDLFKNGPYQLTGFNDRYSMNITDKALIKLSQKDHNKSLNNKLLVEEVNRIKTENLKKIVMSGGEPFLFLYVSDLLKSLPKTVPIEIFTGLGVEEKKFIKILHVIRDFKNITLVISAESTGKNYEFVRAGNSWEGFQSYLDKIADFGINYRFNSVINNLSLLDIANFSFYKTEKITYNICNDPSFLHPCVLDSTSKDKILKYLETAEYLPTEMVSNIVQSIQTSPTDLDRQNLKIYLLEFSKRRGLSLDIFPESFLSWVNDVV
jgi:organic radical activating enzyme